MALIYLFETHCYKSIFLLLIFKLVSHLLPKVYLLWRNPSFKFHLLHFYDLFQKPVVIKLYHLEIFYLFWFSLGFRFLAIYYYTLKNENFTYYYDPFARIIAFLNPPPEFSLIILMIPLFFMLLYQQLFFQLDPVFWKILLKMTTRNDKKFWRQFPKLSSTSQKSKLLIRSSYLWRRVQINRKLWNGSFMEKSLHSNNATIFNTNCIQAKLLALFQRFDCFYWVFRIFLGKI